MAPTASAPSSPGQLCPRQPEKLTWGPKYLGDTRGGSTASAPPRHPRSRPLPHTRHSVPPALRERLSWEGGGPETRDPGAGRPHALTHAGLPALWPFKADFSAVDLGAGKASRATGGGRLPSRKWRRRGAAELRVWRASAAGGGLLSKLPPLPRLFPQLRARGKDVRTCRPFSGAGWGAGWATLGRPPSRGCPSPRGPGVSLPASDSESTSVFHFQSPGNGTASTVYLQPVL